MISLLNYDSSEVAVRSLWGRCEVVIVYPGNMWNDHDDDDADDNRNSADTMNDDKLKKKQWW